MGQCSGANPLGACPASSTGTLAVRNMALADAREIPGTVLNEVEPVGDEGIAVAQAGMNA